MFILQLVLIQGVALVIVIFVLNRVLYSRFAKAMRRLESARRENDEHSKALLEKSEENEKNFKMRIQETEKRAERMRETAEKEALETRAAILRQAEADAVKIREDALERQKKTNHEAESFFDEKAAQMASLALQQLFRDKLEIRMRGYLAEDLLAELAGMDPKRFPGNPGTIVVTSAGPLEEDALQKIKHVLEHKLGRPVTFTAQTDPSITAGLIIRLDQVVLDGSLTAHLKKAVRNTRKPDGL